MARKPTETDGDVYKYFRRLAHDIERLGQNISNDI